MRDISGTPLWMSLNGSGRRKARAGQSGVQRSAKTSHAIATGQN